MKKKSPACNILNKFATKVVNMSNLQDKLVKIEGILYQNRVNDLKI